MSVERRVVDGVSVRPSLEHSLWLAAIALFGIGDLATTIYFIVAHGAAETHPIGAVAIDQFALWVLVSWKVASFVAFYAFSRAVPREYAVGAPIGLTLFGAFTST
ncbi:hypothetical protein [Natrinema hispanicum]|uniref:DUF5658 domain-containing protein n=1 Tax=Natrinema hispanicum TaxID=392421 RepID=A0A1I0F1N9_9EURY|nr:hypothetical protein [Natrinema hispanicum]SET50920.1 hypothetical protein SAMN04488694_107180 [Natrinema hispanicum]